MALKDILNFSKTAPKELTPDERANAAQARLNTHDAEDSGHKQRTASIDASIANIDAQVGQIVSGHPASIGKSYEDIDALRKERHHLVQSRAVEVRDYQALLAERGTAREDAFHELRDIHKQRVQAEIEQYPLRYTDALKAVDAAFHLLMEAEAKARTIYEEAYHKFPMETHQDDFRIPEAAGLGTGALLPKGLVTLSTATDPASSFYASWKLMAHLCGGDLIHEGDELWPKLQKAKAEGMLDTVFPLQARTR